MAIYQHAAYRAETTVAARLAKARLHLAELGETLGPDTARGGSSISHGGTLERMNRVESDIEKYEAQAAAQRGAGGVRQLRTRRR